MDGHHHRASNLRQTNKSHKGGAHTSKRALDKAAHGRVEKSSAATAAPKKKQGLKSLSASEFSVERKADKRNHAKQMAEQRRAEAAVAKRLAGGFGPPKVIAIVGLAAHARPESVAAQMLSLADDAAITSADIGTWMRIGGPIAAVYNNFRQRVLLTAPPRPGQVKLEGAGNDATGQQAQPQQSFVYDVTHTIAGAHAADVIILIADVSKGAEACIDTDGDLLLSCLKATGCPSVIGCISGLDAHASNKHADLRKYATRLFNTELGADHVKLVETGADPFRTLFGSSAGVDSASNGKKSGSSSGDVVLSAAGAGASPSPVSLTAAITAATRDGAALQLVRAVCAVTPKQITWRGNRSYLSALDVSYSPSAASPPTTADAAASTGAGASAGTLRVSGYLRGRPLNVHQLVCVPSGGVYQLSSITRPSNHVFRDLGKGKPGSQQALVVGSTAASSAGVVGSDGSASSVVPAIDNVASIIASASTSAATTAAGASGVTFGTIHVPLLMALGPFAGKVRIPTAASAASASSPLGSASAADGDVMLGGGSSADNNSSSSNEVLAVPDPSLQEPLSTLGEHDGLNNEQTWPMDAEDDEDGDDDGDDDDDMEEQLDDDVDDEDDDGVYGHADDDFAATHGLDPSAPDFKAKKEAAMQVRTTFCCGYGCV